MGLITFVVLADSSRSSYVFGLLTLSLRILLGLHVSLVLLHLVRSFYLRLFAGATATNDRFSFSLPNMSLPFEDF